MRLLWTVELTGLDVSGPGALLDGMLSLRRARSTMSRLLQYSAVPILIIIAPV